jgi:hypothetical protein
MLLFLQRTRRDYLYFVRVQPDHRHLIKPSGRERLCAVNAPSEAGFATMELSPRVYEAVCTDERVIFREDGVEVARHQAVTSGAKVGGDDRELARAQGGLDWEGVEVNVDKANAGEIW